MTVADIARSCLAYPNVRVADAPTTLPDGAWIIRNCIWGALAEMYDVAPELFSLPRQGGVLLAPLETTIALLSATPYIGTYAVSTRPRGSFCTLTIEGEAQDFRTLGYDELGGQTVEFEPGYLGADGSPACTVYHDAFALRVVTDTVINPYPTYTAVTLGNRAWANGEPLKRVASLDQARSQCSHEDGRSATGEPLYFWGEQRFGASYACFYPVPTTATAIAVEVFYSVADIAEASIYTSTATFALDEKCRREILLPLTVEKLMASPIFANPRCTEQVAKDAAAARNRLKDVESKKPREPDFRPPRML